MASPLGGARSIQLSYRGTATILTVCRPTLKPDTAIHTTDLSRPGAAPRCPPPAGTRNATDTAAFFSKGSNVLHWDADATAFGALPSAKENRDGSQKSSDRVA